MQLDNGFEDALADALLDDAESKLVGELDNVVFGAVQAAHDRLRQYADQYDYRVDAIIESFELDTVERSDRTLMIRWGWTHEAAVYLEFGTSDHTIEGDPVLSFVWEERHNPPEWVRDNYEREGNGYRVFLPKVEVDGVRETRFARRSLRYLENELR
jgi:hypothetical protein